MHCSVMNLGLLAYCWHSDMLNTFRSGRLKSSSLQMFLRGNISADNCIRELLKRSRQVFESAIKKNFLVLGFAFFCE